MARQACRRSHKRSFDRLFDFLIELCVPNFGLCGFRRAHFQRGRQLQATKRGKFTPSAESRPEHTRLPDSAFLRPRQQPVKQEAVDKVQQGTGNK